MNKTLKTVVNIAMGVVLSGLVVFGVAWLYYRVIAPTPVGGQ